VGALRFIVTRTHTLLSRYKGDASEASARTMAHIAGLARAAMGLSGEPMEGDARTVTCATDLLTLEVVAGGGIGVMAAAPAGAGAGSADA
jgi:hypothetical protein